MTKEQFIKNLEKGGIRFDEKDDWIDDNLSSVYTCLKDEVITIVAKFAISYSTDSFQWKSLEEARKDIKEGGYIEFD